MDRISRLDVAERGRNGTRLRSSKTLCHMGGGHLVYMVERCGVSRKDGAMLTEERVITRPTEQIRLEKAEPPVPIRRGARPEVIVPDFWERAIFVGVGTAIWVTGFMLMLSILLVFIGLPLFFFGLAMTEAGLKGWR
jgi:hypothetical protein